MGRIRNALARLLGGATPVVSTPATPLWPALPAAPKAGPIISDAALGEATATFGAPRSAWVMPETPPFAAGAAKMALDYAPSTSNIYSWAAQGQFSEGIGFLGYAYLAELSQRPEYRRVSEIFAAEATRKWIKLSGNPDRIDKIEEAMKRLDVRAVVRRVVELDGFFGRGQIFIDLGDDMMDAELSKPLVKEAKIKPGSIKALRIIEPFWSYPGRYDSVNPMDGDFYEPRFWQIMSAQVDASRLLTIVGREMPDMLKPAYSFGGLALSQMIKPYVDNWLRTRQSVSDLLHSFSTMVLATDMSTILAAGSAKGLLSRLMLFNQTRDNRGVMAINKETEELSNVSTPLGTLDKLQAQAQEQIASVAGIPLVILLGVTPSGLNASSDGEVRSFYANVKSYQERTLRAPMHTLLDLIQLDIDGKIDPEIGFEFHDLWEMSETDKAQIRKTNADIDSIYVGVGVVDNQEVRDRITQDEESPYFGATLTGNDDLNAPPPTPEELAAAKVPPGGDPNNDPDPGKGKPKPAAKDSAPLELPAVWLALDDQHWITVHPHGDDHGQPVLIEGSSGGGYTIIGGAGGKLNGTTVNPGSMSGALKDKGGHKTHEEATHAARVASNHAIDKGTSEAHEAAAHAHAVAKEHARVAGEHDKAGEHGKSFAEHKRIATNLADKEKGPRAKEADEASKRAEQEGTAQAHWNAAAAHEEAAQEAARNLTGASPRESDKTARAEHKAKAAEHVREAEKLEAKGPKESPGDKAERLSTEADKLGTPEAHEEAAAALSEAAVAALVDRNSAIAGAYANGAAKHFEAAKLARMTPYDRAAAEADKATKRAESVNSAEAHEAAYAAHRKAAEEATGPDAAKLEGKHLVAAEEHKFQATKQKAPAIGAEADRLSAVAKKEKTLEAHTAAMKAHIEALNAIKAAGITDGTYRVHYNAYLDHRKKVEALQKKERAGTRVGERFTPEGKAELAQRDKAYANKSADEIRTELYDRFGLHLRDNDGVASNAYTDAYTKHYSNQSTMTDAERAASEANVNELREVARRATVGNVRSLSRHNLTATSGTEKKNAEASRRAIGHTVAALEHLESQGFKIKEVLSRHNIAYVPATVGKYSGLAWQRGGVGHFSLHPEHITEEKLAGYSHNDAVRKEKGMPKWTVGNENPANIPIHTAIHELAHAVGMHQGVGSPERLQAILRNMVPNPTERRNWIETNISEYGASNAHETDAELASLVAGPGYVRGTMPKELEDHVDRLFGRVASPAAA